MCREPGDGEIVESPVLTSVSVTYVENKQFSDENKPATKFCHRASRWQHLLASADNVELYPTGLARVSSA